LNTESDIIEDLISCPDCDLLLDDRKSIRNHALLCPRCGKTLHKEISDSVTKTLVLSITGLLLYLPAVSLPLLTFKTLGFSDTGSVIESVIQLFTSGYYFVSFMVLLSAVVFPLVLLGSIFIVSFEMKRDRSPSYLKKLFKLHLHLEEWAMVEVYLLGIMITIIKMADAADIVFESGIFCFTGLVLICMGTSTIIDRKRFWAFLDRSNSTVQTRQTIPTKHQYLKNTTAADVSLLSCHTCNLLAPFTNEHSPCSRCGDTLHIRKSSSISRTWALILTSVIFFIPANLLPIMRVDFLGVPAKSTIMDGIIYFFEHGSYAIGLIIFIASVVVPLFKVVGLIILLLATKPSKRTFLRQKSKMYRFITFIGRWSMLDIFVIALLTVLVDFGFFTSIHAAPAATYFCIVVASTMFAAITFDPRIMWDKGQPGPQFQTNTTWNQP
jgi:paraquat-inducible protein A